MCDQGRITLDLDYKIYVTKIYVKSISFLISVCQPILELMLFTSFQWPEKSGSLIRFDQGNQSSLPPISLVREIPTAQLPIVESFENKMSVYSLTNLDEESMLREEYLAWTVSSL